MQGVPDLETQPIVSRNWDGMVWQGRENKAENTRGTATEENPTRIYLKHFISPIKKLYLGGTIPLQTLCVQLINSGLYGFHCVRQLGLRLDRFHYLYNKIEFRSISLSL